MGQLIIGSHVSRPFRDRVEAGDLLGRALLAYRGRRAVVLGIPRGGVIVAGQIAHAIDGELDILFSHKIPAPGNPEFAIGSVTEDGQVLLDPRRRGTSAADPGYLLAEQQRQLAALRERATQYRALRPRVALQGRIVIVTDDGVATGSTLEAALRSARGQGPAALIAALPVGAPDSVQRLAELADQFICLRVPSGFEAVGQFYRDFRQVEDAALLEILRQEMRRQEQLKHRQAAPS